jgi:eukaryotic-like serine/threonine-protein kinase
LISAAVVGVKPGDILAQKYRIDRILGAGGMGVVVAAHHLGLDEPVAIKFLRSGTIESSEAVTRFEREARAAVKIKSEHVARVFDVGNLDDGAPYIVMEYLEGEDLAAWLKRRGPLPVEQAADFVLQACEAIAEAHALGIVHRDLKPANLFVIRRPDGALSVKVLDFGISKMLGTAHSRPGVAMTKTSVILGSPLYMSPEQLQSMKDVDLRTDIWALGVILYELVAGSSPFASDTLPEFVEKVLSTAPAPLSATRPDVPAGFEAVVRRCLERDHARRYESIALLASDLLRFAPKHARISLQRVVGVLRAPDYSTTLLDTPPAPPRSDQRALARAAAYKASPPGRGGAWVPLIACLLLGSAAVAILRFRRAPGSAGRQPALATAAQHSPTSAARPPLATIAVDAAPTQTQAPTDAPKSPSAPQGTQPARAMVRPKNAATKASPDDRATPGVSPSSSTVPSSTMATVPTSQDSGALDDRK